MAGSDAAVHAGVAERHGLPRWPSLRGAQRRGSRNDGWKSAGSWPVCSLRGRKRAALHEPPGKCHTPPTRHCEERSDVAVHRGVAERHGLPRFARNDGRKNAGSWTVCSLRGHKQAARDDLWNNPVPPPSPTHGASRQIGAPQRTNPKHPIPPGLRLEKLPLGDIVIFHLAVMVPSSSMQVPEVSP